ncbi:MAG: hypothetical protein ABIH25_00685 [Candidatus Woesearchaeota archaeon]
MTNYLMIDTDEMIRQSNREFREACRRTDEMIRQSNREFREACRRIDEMALQSRPEIKNLYNVLENI